MKKPVFLLLSCVMLILCLTGCSHMNIRTTYSFMYDADQIEKIEKGIAFRTGNGDNNTWSPMDITVDSRLDESDIERFMTDLKNVDCHTYFGPPNYLWEGTSVIKISYYNGAYELISPGVQDKYTEKTEQLGTGKCHFDKEQFDKLVSDYFA